MHASLCSVLCVCVCIYSQKWASLRAPLFICNSWSALIVDKIPSAMNLVARSVVREGELGRPLPRQLVSGGQRRGGGREGEEREGEKERGRKRRREGGREGGQRREGGERGQRAAARQPNLEFPPGTGNPNSDASFGALDRSCPAVTKTICGFSYRSRLVERAGPRQSKFCFFLLTQ